MKRNALSATFLTLILTFLCLHISVAAPTIQAKRDIPYLQKPGKSPNPRQMLDIYYQDGWKNKPVFVFIHGGGWQQGSKAKYFRLGRTFAEQGFVTVVINYRLSPEVVHPGHIEDCAAAFAWVHKNIAGYGGNPKKIYVAGHSAGGHLSSLLATDPRYLKTYNLSPANIAAVIPISGVYDVTGVQKSKLLQNLETRYNKMRNAAFTRNETVWQQASPITHVRKNTPPMLILYGDKENVFVKNQSQRFHDALNKTGAPVEMMPLPGLDHRTVVSQIGGVNDGTTKFVVEFMRNHGAK